MNRSTFLAIVERDIAYLRTLPATLERERQIEALRTSAELYFPQFSSSRKQDESHG